MMQILEHLFSNMTPWSFRLVSFQSDLEILQNNLQNNLNSWKSVRFFAVYE